MTTRKVTTLELNITSRTAKTFFAELSMMAKNARTEISMMNDQLNAAKAEMAAGRKEGESDKDWSRRQQELMSNITATEDAIKKLSTQTRVFDTLMKGQLTNINQLAKAMDDMSGRSLKELNAALNEYNKKMLNIGKKGNEDRDMKFLIEYGHLVSGIRQRVNELRASALDLERDARTALQSMGMELKKIPGIIDTIEGALNNMGGNDALDKLEQKMKALRDGKYSGGTVTSLYDTLIKYQKSFVEGTEDWNRVESAIKNIMGMYDLVRSKQAVLKADTKQLKALEQERSKAVAANNTEEADAISEQIKILEDKRDRLKAEIKKENSAAALRSADGVVDAGNNVLETIDHAREGYTRLKEDLDALRSDDGMVNRLQKDGSIIQEKLTASALVGDMSKVLPFVQSGTKEYKDLFEAMKMVYTQDWNIDRMKAVRDALKENVQLLDRESQQFQDYMKLIAQFDARIMEAENSWRDLKGASSETLRSMQQELEKVLADNNLDGNTKASAEKRLADIVNERKNRAMSVLNDYAIRSTASKKEITDSINMLNELANTSSLTEDQMNELNNAIVRGEGELKKKANAMELVRMKHQLLNVDISKLSNDALERQIKAWEREAEAIQLTEGASKHYLETIRPLKKMYDTLDDRKRSEATVMLGDFGTDGAAQTVDEYRKGIKLANELIESGRLETEEIGKWQDCINAANAEIQKLTEQQKRSEELARISAIDIHNIGREFLPSIVNGWKKVVEEERQAGGDVDAYVKKIGEAEELIKKLDVSWSKNVLGNTSAYSTEEVSKAIKIAEEEARKLKSAGDDTWKVFISDATRAKKELDSFAQEGKIKLMTDSLDMMSQSIRSNTAVSKEALRNQAQFWRSVRDNANSTAEQIMDASAKVNEAEALISQNNAINADSVIGSVSIGTYNASLSQMKSDLEMVKEYFSTLDKVADAGRYKEAGVAIAEMEGRIKAVSNTLMSFSEVDSIAANLNLDDAIYQHVNGSEARMKQLIESVKLWKDKLSRESLFLDGPELDDVNEKIARLNALMSKLKSNTDGVSGSADNLRESLSDETIKNVLEDLNHATPNELKEVLKELEIRIGNIRRGEGDYTKMAEDIRRVRSAMQGVNAEQNKTLSGLEKAIERIKTYVMVYMSFQKGLDVMKDMFNRSKQLSDLVSDVQKRAFTNLSFKEGKENAVEIGKQLDSMVNDTRTSQEELYKLAATAGLLGLKTKEDILGFTDAADMMKVALVELGEEGAAQLVKISTLTGDVDRYGPGQALTRTASAINALTAASAASAGPITDFISRVGAVGASAHMTMGDIAGLGATLDALGQPMELSGTSVNRFIMSMRSNTLGIAAALGINPEQLQMLVSSGQTMEAMVYVLEQMKLKGADVYSIFGELGGEGVRMKQTMESLMNNTELLREQVKLSNDEYRMGTSVINEYNIKNRNTAAIMERVRNMWSTMFNNSEAEGAWRGFSIIILGITKFLTAWPTVMKSIIGYIAGMSAQMYLFGESTDKAFAGTTRLHAVLSKCATTLKKGILGGIVGIAASFALSKIMEWVSKLYDKLYHIEKRFEDINELLEKSRQKAGSMFKAVEYMYKNGMQGTKEFKDVLKQLNDEFGTYIGYTITETTSLNQLAAAQRSVNDAMMQQISIEGSKKQILDAQEKYKDEKVEARNKMTQFLSSTPTSYVNVNKKYGGSSTENVPVGKAKTTEQIAEFDAYMSTAIYNAIKSGYKVDNNGRVTDNAESIAKNALLKAMKESGIFGTAYGMRNGETTKENDLLLSYRILTPYFLDYLKAYFQEDAEIKRIFRERDANLSVWSKRRNDDNKNELKVIYEEYEKMRKEGPAGLTKEEKKKVEATDGFDSLSEEKKKEAYRKATEDKAQKHYARMLELQSNYEQKYNSSLAGMTMAEQTEASKKMNAMKKRESELRDLAGMMSQFGFENLDWSKMSGDELKRASDELNKIWKHYGANGDWHAFGNRVGQTFAAEADAQKWIDEQVSSIAERADFLKITRPSGWKYPSGGGEDPTQQMMTDYMKKLEDYYNQKKARVKKEDDGSDESRKITEERIRLIEEEFSSARTGLQNMYLKDMSTMIEEEQRQFKLLTRKEIDAIKRRKAELEKAIEEGTPQVKPVVEGKVNAANRQRAFIDRVRNVLENEMQARGIDPKQIYNLLAQMGLESAWGTSRLAREYYNFGGMTLGTTSKGMNAAYEAVKDKNGKTYRYVKFESIEEYVREYLDYLGRKGAFKGTSRDFAQNVKKFGYAEDPGYVDKLNRQARAVVRIMQDNTLVGRNVTAEEIGTMQEELDRLNGYKNLETAIEDYGFGRDFKKNIAFINKSLAENDPKKEKMRSSVQEGASGSMLEYVTKYNEQLQKLRKALIELHPLEKMHSDIVSSLYDIGLYNSTDTKEVEERTEAFFMLVRKAYQFGSEGLAEAVASINEELGWKLSEDQQEVLLEQLSVFASRYDEMVRKEASRIKKNMETQYKIATESGMSYADAKDILVERVERAQKSYSKGEQMGVGGSYIGLQASDAAALRTQRIKVELAKAELADLEDQHRKAIELARTEEERRLKEEAFSIEETERRKAIRDLTDEQLALQEQLASKVLEHLKGYRSIIGGLFSEFQKNGGPLFSGAGNELTGMDLAKAEYMKSVGKNTSAQYVVYKGDGTYEMKWMTEEQRMIGERDIAARNARIEATNKALQEWGEKMSQDIVEAVQRRYMEGAVETDAEAQAEQRKLELTRSRIALQESEEQRFTELFKSELNKRMEALLAYVEKLDGLSSSMMSDNGTGVTIQQREVIADGVAGITSTVAEAGVEASNAMWSSPGIYNWEGQAGGSGLGIEAGGPDENAVGVELDTSGAMDNVKALKTEIAGIQKTTDTTMSKSEMSVARSTSGMIQAANLYGIVYNTMMNDNLTVTQKVGMSMLQFMGQVAMSMLSAYISEVVSVGAKNAAQSVGRAFAENNFWVAMGISAAVTAAIGAATALATKKMKKSQQEIAQATGASAGKMTTGMLTYATGRYLDDENFRAKAGMLAFSDGYNLSNGYSIGNEYDVDGADGKGYRARYVGSVSNLGTGIQRGVHFGIFSEEKPEMVIDGDTTEAIHSKYPELEQAILSVRRTGSYQPEQLLGINYDNVTRSIAILRNSRALSFAHKMPAFDEGNYPYEGGSSQGHTSAMYGISPELTAALIESISRLNVQLDKGIHASLSSKDYARQKRFEKRMGIKDGLND